MAREAPQWVSGCGWLVLGVLVFWVAVIWLAWNILPRLL